MGINTKLDQLRYDLQFLMQEFSWLVQLKKETERSSAQGAQDSQVQSPTSSLSVWSPPVRLGIKRQDHSLNNENQQTYQLSWTKVHLSRAASGVMQMTVEYYSTLH